MSRTKLLVIGANGFVGRNVATAAIRNGWEVTGIVHRSRDSVPNGIAVLDRASMADAGQPDAIVLAAASIASGGVNADATSLKATNIKLVLDVVECFPAAHIVFCSSVSVYGKPTAVPLTEGSPFNQPELYGLSKLAGEAIIRSSGPHTIIRFSSLYGPGMARHTFVPRTIDDARNKRTITLYGDGSRRQDYLHIDDAAQLALAAAEQRAAGVFLGANGRSISNIEVANAVCKALPDTKIIFTGADQSPSFEFDAQTTRRTFGNWPTIHPSVGIEKLCHA